jgi:hypothetical protein
MPPSREAASESGPAVAHRRQPKAADVFVRSGQGLASLR